jgi:hypothetical protein
MASAAWVLHDDPAGFTLCKPHAWRVQVGRGDAIAVSDPRCCAAALVRVRRLPAEADLAEWLRLCYAATEPGLHGVRIATVLSLGPQQAQAVFDYGSQVFLGRARVTARRHGERATLLIAAAAREQYDRRLPELIRILDSVRWRDADPANAGWLWA